VVTGVQDKQNREDKTESLHRSRPPSSSSESVPVEKMVTIVIETLQEQAAMSMNYEGGYDDRIIHFLQLLRN
jgi:hypothetical protein